MQATDLKVLIRTVDSYAEACSLKESLKLGSPREVLQKYCSLSLTEREKFSIVQVWIAGKYSTVIFKGLAIIGKESK